MNKSLNAFAQFRSGLKNHKQDPNGDEWFQGIVNYSWHGRTESEVLKVILHTTTIEGGKIEIEERGDINSDNCHVEFNPYYQEYTCTPNGHLIINGSSDKIQEYKVEISEFCG